LSTRRRGSLHSTSGGPYTFETTDGDDDGDGDEGSIPLEQFRSGSPDADGALSNEETIPVGTAELSSRRRGMFFGGVCALLVAAAWILFLVTAWLRLRSKSERG
jgi:hypothetical protein